MESRNLFLGWKSSTFSLALEEVLKVEITLFLSSLVLLVAWFNLPVASWMLQKDSVPAPEEILLVLRRIFIVVTSFATHFVLFQTVPVLVTGGGWEEEVVRRITAYKTIGFFASVCWLGFHKAPSCCFPPFPPSSVQQWVLLSKRCLLFVLSLCVQLGWAFPFNQHRVAQIPFWNSTVIRSQAVLAHHESQGWAFRCSLWLPSGFAFRIILRRRSSV